MRRARLQQHLRHRRRRRDPRRLRQGPSRPVRRVPAVPRLLRRPRPPPARSRCRGGFAAGSIRRARSTVPPAPPFAPLICYEVDLSRRGRCRTGRARAGCSTSPTTPGSAIRRVPISISSRRGCGRSRKDCRWSAPPIPASRRSSMRYGRVVAGARRRQGRDPRRRLAGRAFADALFAASATGRSGAFHGARRHRFWLQRGPNRNLNVN